MLRSVQPHEMARHHGRLITGVRVRWILRSTASIPATSIPEKSDFIDVLGKAEAEIVAELSWVN
jgi:hypothetical protein